MKPSEDEKLIKRIETLADNVRNNSHWTPSLKEAKRDTHSFLMTILQMMDEMGYKKEE